MGGQLTEVADVLERAADLIARPGAWVQGCYSRGCGLCMVGAVNVAQGLSPDSEANYPAIEHLRDMFAPKYIAAFNDAPERTQAEVVAALRSAAAAARQKGEGK